MITNPPYKRKKKAASSEYLYIDEAANFTTGTPIWSWNTNGCFFSTPNGTYTMEDASTIEVSSGIIV